MSGRVALPRVRAHRSSSPSPYMRMVVDWGPTVGPAMARSTYRVVPVQRPTRSGRRREAPADVAEEAGGTAAIAALASERSFTTPVARSISRFEGTIL